PIYVPGRRHSGKAALRIVRIVCRPLCEELQYKHGRRDSRQDETEYFETEIREVPESGLDPSGRTDHEKDHRRGPEDERSQYLGFEVTRSGMAWHFLRLRLVQDRVFPLIFVVLL